MRAWSHLPNAAHIDAILADVQARPEVWDAGWYALIGPALDTAWDAAWRRALDAGRVVAWGAARVNYRAAWDAIRALIAWDESAALLDLTPDALRTIISTCDGDVKHQAVLLLPAVIARSAP